MDWGAFAGLTVIFALLLLLVQRAESQKRRIVFVVMLIGAELVRRYLLYRNWAAEGFWALLAAVVLNVAFWVLYGRYHPPHSSDEITVIGND